MSRLRPVLLLALLLPLLRDAATASAQVSQIARVAGLVRDEAGKPIPGASITATQPRPGSGDVHSVHRRQGPVRRSSACRRGSWTFSVSAPGFKTSRVGGDVQVGRPNAPINVTLMKGTPAVIRTGADGSPAPSSRN